MKTKKLLAMFVAVGIVVFMAPWSQAMSSLNFELLKSRLTGGGGERSSTNYGVKDLTGQWYGGGISSGSSAAVNVNFYSAGSQAVGTTISFTPADTLEVCALAQFVVGASDVADLYGYQFDVSYDETQVTSEVFFDNSFFDTSNPSEATTYAACSAGVCTISSSKIGAVPTATGSGPLAAVEFTPIGPGGTFDLAVSNILLIDGAFGLITVSPPAGPVTATACETVSLSGAVTLQGRTAVDYDGSLSLNDTDAVLASQTATIEAGTGTFSFAAVPFQHGGATYRLEAAAPGYLTNELELNVDSAIASPPVTRLLGGDANNDTMIDVTDITCIAGNFGDSAVECGSGGSSDINADTITNIQDMAISAGNYTKMSFQTW